MSQIVKLLKKVQTSRQQNGTYATNKPGDSAKPNQEVSKLTGILITLAIAEFSFTVLISIVAFLEFYYNRREIKNMISIVKTQDIRINESLEQAKTLSQPVRDIIEQIDLLSDNLNRKIRTLSLTENDHHVKLKEGLGENKRRTEILTQDVQNLTKKLELSVSTNIKDINQGL